MTLIKPVGIGGTINDTWVMDILDIVVYTFVQMEDDVVIRSSPNPDIECNLLGNLKANPLRQTIHRLDFVNVIDTDQPMD